MIRAYMLLFLTVCLAVLVGDNVQAVTVMSNTEILRQTEPITAYTLAGRATTINLPTTLMLPSYRVSYQELNALLAAYGLTGSVGVSNYRVRETTVAHSASNACNFETSAPNDETDRWAESGWLCR